MKYISILGSTGSIGTNTLSVIDAFPQKFTVKALVTDTNIILLEKQIQKYKPQIAVVFDKSKVYELQKRIKGIRCKILSGEEGCIEAVSLPQVDLVVCAISGIQALLPLLSAIKENKNIAIANKEVIVSAGRIIMQEVKKRNISFFPIDSEHSGIFQCLQKEKKNTINRVILTASGGAFLNYPKNKLSKVTVKEALRHPRWKMGRKITVDSATLLNKAREVIECHFLFDIEIDKIEVLIHPQSVIHSLVEFVDHSILAQLSISDMKIPIQYALNLGERFPNAICSLNLAQIKSLEFQKPNLKKFPCLEYGYKALKIGKTMPAVLNASGEETTKLFLEEKIGFLEIMKIIEKVMEKHKVKDATNIKEILAADKWAREEVKRISCT